MTINEAITILHAVVAEDPSVMVHEAWQTLKSLVLAKQTNNTPKSKIVTSPHCIMNYCAMGEAECVADEQHCPYDQRGKT